MTRFARVAASAVLVALSVCAQASAAFTPAPSEQAARLDMGRVFSHVGDSWFAEFAAPPALTVSFVSQSVFNLAALPPLELPQFAPALPPGSGVGVAQVNLALPQLRPYKYVPSTPAYSSASINVPDLTVPEAEPQTVRTAPPAIASAQSVAPVRFGSYEPYSPSLKSVSGDATVPVRVGGVHFQGAFRAMQLCGTADEAAACSSLHDTHAQNFTAGTNFNVRAGKSDVKVQISSSIEHLTNEAAGVFPYVPIDPDAQAGLSYFGLTDVVKHGVNAQVAVPVSPRITIGLQYDRAHYQGDYNTALLPGFDARKDTYLGNVTYQLPNTNSAITLSARQYRYQDAFAPNFNLTQTRADVNFTVKF